MKATDAYTVKYWIQGEDTYWKTAEDIIIKNGKDKHKSVEAEWKFFHKKDNVKLIGIVYQ